MKLLTLDLVGYRQFADAVHLDVPDGLVGVCGPNGVGKSKLIESIGFALYGPSRRLLPTGDQARDLTSYGQKPSTLSVTLRFQIRGQVFKVQRTQKTALLEVEGGSTLADTPRGVTKRVSQLLRLSPDAYLGTFLARQREVARLLSLRSSDRQRLVNRLIGISQVETAIEFAKAEKVRRSQIVAVAAGALTVTPEDAEVTVDARTESLDEATRHLIAMEELRTASAGEVQAVRASLEAALSALAQLSDLERQMTELNEHKSTLEREAAGSRMRLERAEAAELELEAALSTLESASGIEEELIVFGLLNEREKLGEQLAVLEGMATEREELAISLESASARREALGESIAEARRGIAAAETARDQSTRHAELVNSRRKKAQEFGADAICEVCGQRYGAGLATAIAHLDQESAELETKANDYEREREAVVAQLSKLRSDQETLDSSVARLKSSLSRLSEVPGRMQMCRDQFDAVESQLTQLGRKESEYDEVAHQTATRLARTAAAAKSRLDGLRLLFGTKAEADESLASAEADLEALEARILNLQSAIDVTKEQTEAYEALRQALSDREADLQDAIQEVTAAVAAVARQEALCDEAIRDLAVARQRVREHEAAQRAALVAEHTTDVLVRLLTEITNEARPRLAELMDTWARSLLGARFRSIDLREDYGVLADNGSGPHELGHFSGGEQTVLAVMLRIAISMFCRERAGFDTGFLILDEVFGDQDSERRVLLVEFLSEIQRQYHQVVVVNHVDDVTAMLDSIIDVVPLGPNTSTAVVRS